MSQPTGQDGPMKAVPAEVQTLNEVIDTVSQCVAELEKQLGSVLRQAPAVVDEASGRSPCSCELGDVIQQSRLRLGDVSARLTDIIGRLEL